MESEAGDAIITHNEYGSMLTVSAVPDTCRGGDSVVLGIDEAGRGPVLGPMVYGAAYWRESDDATIRKLGFNDSKALTHAKRSTLLTRLQGEGSRIGYVVHSISAREIGANMLRRHPYSLNALSFDSAEGMVRAVQERGVKVAHVIVDTVGDPDRYKSLLERRFRNGRYPAPRFTVEKKADANFPVVGAASICAKVTRDAAMVDYAFPEPGYLPPGYTAPSVPASASSSSSSASSLSSASASTSSPASQSVPSSAPFHSSHAFPLAKDGQPLGSGYPGDPDTKRWIREGVDPVFGYPRLARFSWSTVGVLLEGAREAAAKAAGVSVSREMEKGRGKGGQAPMDGGDGQDGDNHDDDGDDDEDEEQALGAPSSITKSGESDSKAGGLGIAVEWDDDEDEAAELAGQFQLQAFFGAGAEGSAGPSARQGSSIPRCSWLGPPRPGPGVPSRRADKGKCVVRSVDAESLEGL